MCKILYRASDGKEFSTKEECTHYMLLPRVYIVKRSSMNFGTSIVDVFTTKHEAELHYPGECYSILTHIIRTERIRKSVHEKITNTVKKPPPWFRFLTGLIK